MNEEKNPESNAPKEFDQQGYVDGGPLRSRMDALNVALEPEERDRSVEKGKAVEKATAVTSFDIYMAESTLGSAPTGSSTHGQMGDSLWEKEGGGESVTP